MISNVLLAVVLGLGASSDDGHSTPKPATKPAVKHGPAPATSGHNSGKTGAVPMMASVGFDRLVEGNARFVKSRLAQPRRGAMTRYDVAKGQHPFAIVLTCADSRVPPEILFDQGLGDLFVVRVAGNVVDTFGLASIEYAVEHLGARAIVVLGHERCGAVKAACDAAEAMDHEQSGPKDGHAKPSNITKLVEHIVPSVVEAKPLPGILLDNAIAVNVKRGIEQLKYESHILAEYLAKKEIAISGAVYDLDTGKVVFQKP